MCIVDGTYTIKNATAQTSFLTMDKSLAQQPTYVFGYPWCGRDTQKWRIMKRGNSYNIQNVGANKYLTVDGNAGDNRSVFGMQRPSNWTIAQCKENHVRLYIQHTPFNLDLAGHGDASPGTRVSVWGNNPDNVNQCWILEKVQPAPKPSALNKASIHSGAYLVVNAHNNKVLDLSASDNKSIITFPLHGGANQQWRIEPLGEGYSIRSISSGKYVTFEERIGDGALVIANGFPVSWDVSSVWNSSDVHIRWPMQQVAVALVMPPAVQDANPVQLQTLEEDNKWQRWRLVGLEQCPRELAAPQSVVRQPAVPVTQGSIVSENPADDPVDDGSQGRTTETATVSVTEDEHSIKTTRTTVTTVTVSTVELK